MNKLITVSLIVLILFGIFTLLIFHTEGNKAKSTNQYTSPIGPTKNPPYILNSSLISDRGKH